MSFLNFSSWFMLLALPLYAATCDSLASIKLPNTSITAAHLVPAGAFQPPVSPPAAKPSPLFQASPPFCRVAAVIKPVPDSHIEFELWLPAENWNGRLQLVGNGGWAGAINYVPMATALQAGYATASTDTGHKGSSPQFAVGHPEKLIDFAHRAVHETTVQSKSILTAFYGQHPKYSYWNGCSAGGGQGLMEAWRYPNDFDGIIAGAISRPLHMGLVFGWIAAAQTVRRTPASFIPENKFPLIHRAAMNACDAADGLADGLIQDPSRCRFDPAVLQCKAADETDCLSPDQVIAARQLYAPVLNPRTRKMIYPGLPPGSELGWGVVAGPQPFRVGPDTLKYLFFQNPDWDFRTLDLGSYEEAEAKLGAANNPMNADLRPFLNKGGKLLLYHGWNDTVVAPGESTRFYQRVIRTLGNSAKAAGAIRLFMVPGMAHCGGGYGPNTFDVVTALKDWVETKQAPTRILASRSVNGKVDRTRPLCPFPQTAVYKGSGSIDEAANFICRIP